MTAHAKFGPSKAHRWIPCPGSIALEPESKSGNSRFADEGTAAHFWGAGALQNGKQAAFYHGAQVQPSADGDTFTCDDKFVINVQVYLDDVRSRIAGGTLLVEQRLNFSESIDVPDQFGTGDAVIISADAVELVVEDLKYGVGEQVYAKDNYQCMLYAVATLETYEPILGDSVERVRGVICQPRLDHIDEEVWTREQLREFAEKAKLAARYALEGVQTADVYGTDFLEENNPELFKPGEKQCRWCPAKATCKALAKQVSADIYDDFSMLLDPDKLKVAPEPQMPPLARLAAIYQNLDLIEGWARAVRGRVESEVMGGMTIEGPDGLPLKIVEGKKGNRAWIEGKEDQVAGLLAGMGRIGPDKAFKPREVITPSVADKMLGKKGKKSSTEYEQILKPFVIQPDGKAKIALGSDPRPPFEGAASESDFSTVETGD